MAVTLEQSIRRYIQLPTNPSGTGWFSVLCKVCNDHGRKGSRGGFRFDGDKVAYHCFNCGHSIVYDPANERMPAKMIEVMRSFGIPDDEWQAVMLSNMTLDGPQSAPVEAPARSIEPTVISLPNHFYPLANASPNDKWAELARVYLEVQRGVDPNSYNFMLAEPTGDPASDEWLRRLIIPIYKDKNLIFYTGRDLTEKATQKYLSPSFSKEKIIYGFDKLFRETAEPLYIVEGWFDAFAVDGVGLLGNEISNAHVAWLNRSQRRKVYIPDRLGDGWVAAERALELGWDVSTPEIGDSKDMSAAVQKYGRMYVLKSIADKTFSKATIGMELAKTILGFYCSYDPTDKGSRKKKDRAASSPKRTRR